MRCWRKPAASPARSSRRSIASATPSARRSRTASSPRRRAGRKPITTWRDGGWNGLAAPAEWGGQALPQIVNIACIEMWNAASMAFADGPMLTMAAIDALHAHGSDALKRTYLEKARVRRMDRHHAAHRAAGRLRRRRAAHARRARRRRHLSHQGPEDLHHLRRARSHRQHHPFRAGAPARCAARHARHFAVPGAEIPAQCRRLARRAQRRARPFGRAQARHSRLADLHHDPRRRRRRHRLSDRRGKCRHGLHVHHDEPRAARGRPAGRRHRRSAPRSRRWLMRASASKAARPA